MSMFTAAVTPRMYAPVELLLVLLFQAEEDLNGAGVLANLACFSHDSRGSVPVEQSECCVGSE